MYLYSTVFDEWAWIPIAPWNNHAGHRTVSWRRRAGSKSAKPKHNWTKRRKARQF